MNRRATALWRRAVLFVKWRVKTSHEIMLIFSIARPQHFLHTVSDISRTADLLTQLLCPPLTTPLAQLPRQPSNLVELIVQGEAPTTGRPRAFAYATSPPKASMRLFVGCCAGPVRLTEATPQRRGTVAPAHHAKVSTRSPSDGAPLRAVDVVYRVILLIANRHDGESPLYLLAQTPLWLGRSVVDRWITEVRVFLVLVILPRRVVIIPVVVLLLAIRPLRAPERMQLVLFRRRETFDRVICVRAQASPFLRASAPRQ